MYSHSYVSEREFKQQRFVIVVRKQTQYNIRHRPMCIHSTNVWWNWCVGKRMPLTLTCETRNKTTKQRYSELNVNIRMLLCNIHISRRCTYVYAMHASWAIMYCICACVWKSQISFLSSNACIQFWVSI